jgi:hypothetical protein
MKRYVIALVVKELHTEITILLLVTRMAQRKIN